MQAESEDADPAVLYLQLRRLKREIMLANPLLDFGPCCSANGCRRRTAIW
jgi:hypothetical protein